MKTSVTLDKFQKQAVNHLNGPLLIIAGAGTGKTTVITERVKHLVIDKKTPASKILALTFTEKAAFEMEERIDKEMPYGYTQMWISTFHSFCDRILRNEAIHIGLNPSYRLLTETESVLFIRQNLFKLNLSYFSPLGNPNKFLFSLIQHFSRLKDEDVTPTKYSNFVKNNKRLRQNPEELKKYKELSNAYTIYEQLKAKEGVMDFSDLISNTLKLFRERKNILKAYQNQFEYILVDEFQDTNYSQNELAVLLSGNKKNITVVGDDDQSIYRFRGSSVSNILQFRKTFSNCKVITLVNNYRSTQEILDSSYKLIQNNNPDRLEFKEKVNKKLVSTRRIKGQKIELIYKPRVEDEADDVAKKIIDLVEKNKIEYREIAILVRANEHSETFIRALERRKIPYQFLGPGRLFHQEEIKDLISYLKVIYNFEDSVSLYRVLTLPIFNLEIKTIASLVNLSRKKNYSLFESLENVNELLLVSKEKEKIKKILAMIKNHLKKAVNESAGQVLYYFLTDSGLINKILDYKSFSEEKKAKNIAKFFDKLKTYETEHKNSSVFEVVDWIDLSMQAGESPAAADIDWTENNAINILTVHSSKGLEFKVIFLVNLVSQRFPTRERSEKIPIPQELIKEILPLGDYHLEEERRLFYVGMTRAKDILFFTAANYYGEGKRERKLSPFVYETLGGQETLIKNNIKSFAKNELQLSLLEFESENKMIENKPKNPISYLSYSQIQTFDACPLHYKLKYIIKLPTPQTSALSFGTSVHSVLRDFYLNWKNGRKSKLSDIKNILKDNWINEGYSSKVHEKSAFKNAERIINKYLKNNFDKNNLPLEIEYPFNFKIENLSLGGRIDRIDKIDNNKIEIIDYKTGTTIPTEKELLNNQQLTFYSLAATAIKDEVLDKKPEDIILTLYYLEKDLKLTTFRNKEQLEQAKIDILKKADEIGKSNFLCNKSILCKNCEFKMLCSTFS